MTKTGIAFEDGQPVNVVWPSDPDDELHEADAARLRQETLCRLLQCLTTKANARQAGQRALLLSYLLHIGDCRTQRQLAKRLGVTPGRVSQGLNSLRREFARLSRL